jgi:hypothetical protein
MLITDNQWDLISHSLGVNLYHAKMSNRKKDSILPDEFYRNYFASSDGSKDYKEFKELEELGIVNSWEKWDHIYFGITDLGKKQFRDYFHDEVTSKFKPLSKSKDTYQKFIDMDGHDYFSDFLGIQLPRDEQTDKGWRFHSTKYEGVKGKFCKTKKEAKISYKEALKDYKNNIRYEIENY